MYPSNLAKFENCNFTCTLASEAFDFDRCIQESLWLDSIEHEFINTTIESNERLTKEMEKIFLDNVVELSSYIAKKKKEIPNGLTADGESENVLRARLLTCQIIRKQFFNIIHDENCEGSHQNISIESGHEKNRIDKWTLISILTSCICDDEPQRFQEHFEFLIKAYPISCVFSLLNNNSPSTGLPFGNQPEEYLSVIAETFEYYMKYFLELRPDSEPAQTQTLLRLALDFESQHPEYFSAKFFEHWCSISQKSIESTDQNSIIQQQIVLIDRLLKRLSSIASKDHEQTLQNERLKLEIIQALRNKELEAATKRYNLLREFSCVNRESLIFKIKIGIELQRSSKAVSRKELYEYFQTYASNFLNKEESAIQLLKLSDDFYLWVDVLLLEWDSDLEKRVLKGGIAAEYISGFSSRLEAFLMSFDTQSRDSEFINYLDKVIRLLKTISCWLKEAQIEKETMKSFLMQLINLGEKMNRRGLHCQVIELFQLLPLSFSISTLNLRKIYFCKIDSQIKIFAPLEHIIEVYQLMRYASEDERDFFMQLTKLKIIIYQYHCKIDEKQANCVKLFVEELSSALQELFNLETIDIQVFRIFCCDYLGKSKVLKKLHFGGILQRYLFDIISLFQRQVCPVEGDRITPNSTVNLEVLHLIAAALQDEILLWINPKIEPMIQSASERNLIEFFLTAFCKAWDVLFEIHSESLKNFHKIRTSELSSLMEEVLDSIQIITRVLWNAFILLQQSKLEADTAIHFLRLHIQLQTTTIIFKYLRAETPESFKKLMDFRMNTAFEIIEDHYHDLLKSELTGACEKVIRYACWVLEDSRNQAQTSKALIEEAFFTLKIIEERMSLRIEPHDLSFHLKSTYFGIMGLYSPDSMKSYLERIVCSFQANPEFLLILAKTASEFNQFQAALFAWNSYSVYAFVNDKLKELPDSAYLLALELVGDSSKRIKIITHMISKIALFMKETSFEEVQETGILLSIQLGMIYKQLLEKPQDSSQKQLIKLVLKLYAKLLEVLPENFDCLLESEYGIVDPECKYYEHLFKAP